MDAASTSSNSTNVLLNQHRELWIVMSRTLSTEIVRMRMEMLHHERNYQLCHHLGRKLWLQHAVVMFNEYLPYMHLNIQLAPRQLDYIVGPVLADYPFTTTFLPEYLPRSNELFVQLNVFIDLLVNLRHTDISSIPLYSDNKLFAANESVRRLLHYLICTGVQMINIDQVLQPGLSFPYESLKFLLHQLHHRELYVDHHLLEVIHKYGVNTNNFVSYNDHVCQRVEPNFISPSNLTTFAHDFCYYIAQETNVFKMHNYIPAAPKSMLGIVKFVSGPQMFNFFDNVANIPASLQACDSNAINDLNDYGAMSTFRINPLRRSCSAPNLR